MFELIACLRKPLLEIPSNVSEMFQAKSLVAA
jgi:hypothetical protein